MTLYALYSVYFDRVPSDAEVSNWVNALRANATRAQIIKEFSKSAEWAILCARYGINP